MNTIYMSNKLLYNNNTGCSYIVKPKDLSIKTGYLANNPYTAYLLTEPYDKHKPLIVWIPGGGLSSKKFAFVMEISTVPFNNIYKQTDDKE